MASRDRTVVLAGAGHAHLVALGGWRGRVLPFRLVVIDPGRFCYSGMATGVLAGDYEPREASLDPRPPVEEAGGELLRDRVTSIDRRARRLRLESGGEMSFDLLSLNLGSRVRGARAARVYPVKPIAEVYRLARDLDSGAGDEEVVVAGGGVSGVEIACCAAARLARAGGRGRVALVHDGAEPAPGLPPRGRRKLADALRERGVRLHMQRGVAGWDDRQVRLDGGRSLPFTRLVLATGLEPPPLVQELDLPVTASGLLVDRDLRSPADPGIFAAGDCADVAGLGLPKVGVYGVRAARVLAGNLESAVRGESLRDYRPQRRYLSIVNLGRGEAMATWDGLAASGRLALRLKDAIDRRFLRRLAG